MIRINKATIATIVMQHAHIFVHGSIFSADVLDNIFQIEIPQIPVNDAMGTFNALNSRNFKRLRAYTALNKFLATRGIAIHQSTTNNVTVYKIDTVAGLPKTIKYYRIKGKRATKRSSILLAAYNQLAIPGIE